MRLHDLGTTKYKKPQRIGRGGKRGTTSGRGQKGQKSRAGRKMRPAMRDLISRLPKKCGFRNKPTSETYAINIKDIKRLSGDIDVVRLKKERFVPTRYAGVVKLIGNAKLEHAIAVKGVSVSKGARASIEAAKGSVATEKAAR